MASANGSSAASSEDGDQNQLNGPIVHVRADSDSTLDDLFAIVTPGHHRQLQVPMKMRKLPQSFFKPPASGSRSPSYHSRENSVDNTPDPLSPGMQSVGSPQPPSPAGGQQQQRQPFHSRAHSSPASLQQNLSLQQQGQTHVHLRQPSYDVSSPANELGPMPPGWEEASTPEGQRYFMNHITKTTQWEDPRVGNMRNHLQHQLQQQMNGVTLNSPAAAAAQRPAPPSHANSSPLTALQRAGPVRAGSADSLGPLPQGWEEGIAPDGSKYFINHETKTTTWIDPRKPMQNNRADVNLTQKRQQEMRLQRLENERRALQQRQAELRRMEMERRSVSQENVQQAMNQTQEMLMRQTLAENSVTSELNPFLGASSGGSGEQAAAAAQQQQQQPGVVGVVNNDHNRQESADSGVGMGSNLQLGVIPEDQTVEGMEVGGTDLDSTLTEATANGPQRPSQAAATGMDTTTDQLISSLPAVTAFGEGLPDNIMQDVLETTVAGGPNQDTLTWL